MFAFKLFNPQIVVCNAGHLTAVQTLACFVDVEKDGRFCLRLLLNLESLMSRLLSLCNWQRQE